MVIRHICANIEATLLKGTHYTTKRHELFARLCDVTAVVGVVIVGGFRGDVSRHVQRSERAHYATLDDRCTLHSCLPGGSETYP